MVLLLLRRAGGSRHYHRRRAERPESGDHSAESAGHVRYRDLERRGAARIAIPVRRHLFLVLRVFAVEGALLLALFAGLRRPVAFLRVGTALTPGADEGGDHVTVVARGRLAMRLHHLLAFLADGGRAALAAGQE